MCFGGSLLFSGSSQKTQAIQTSINTSSKAYRGLFCESGFHPQGSSADDELYRFISRAQPESITLFEQTLFPPFTEILQGDIDRA